MAIRQFPIIYIFNTINYDLMFLFIVVCVVSWPSEVVVMDFGLSSQYQLALRKRMDATGPEFSLVLLVTNERHE